MKISRIYEVPTAVPVNKDAGQVLGKGVHYEDKVPDGRDHWKAPPKTEPIPSDMPNLVGRTVGKLRVLGKYKDPRKREGKAPAGRWVVRCNCGDYELRTTKALQNPLNANDHCAACEHLRVLRKRDRFNRTGRYE